MVWPEMGDRSMAYRVISALPDGGEMVVHCPNASWAAILARQDEAAGRVAHIVAPDEIAASAPQTDD
jgi:hypothetical protein